MPTPRRAPTALLVRRGGERLLFDCAEGTQRQLLKSSVGLIELREIFIGGDVGEDIEDFFSDFGGGHSVANSYFFDRIYGMNRIKEL